MAINWRSYSYRKQNPAKIYRDHVFIYLSVKITDGKIVRVNAISKKWGKPPLSKSSVSPNRHLPEVAILSSLHFLSLRTLNFPMLMFFPLEFYLSFPQRLLRLSNNAAGPFLGAQAVKHWREESLAAVPMEKCARNCWYVWQRRKNLCLKDSEIKAIALSRKQSDSLLKRMEKPVCQTDVSPWGILHIPEVNPHLTGYQGPFAKLPNIVYSRWQ